MEFDDETNELVAKAEAGDADAQHRMSEYFYKIRKYKQTLKWVTKAAEQGHIEAQRALGDYYGGGEAECSGALAIHGIRQIIAPDYKKSVLWLTKAAEQGMADAQYYMGIRYWYGDGVVQDYNQAAQWFAQAAQQEEYPQCQTWEVMTASRRLCFMFYCGYGVARDYEQSKKWYAKAAEMGDESAGQMLSYINQIKKPINL
ncbi:MAG: sel1 repeat family protein [Defluviitaleaceae bacterium]|nr:sel1 repeat family protein [Defluviitaleaceae bacterium]